jgi:radical SAM protein with 4Fe4S-binding SPASM domain
MASLETLCVIRGKKDLGIGFTLQDSNYLEIIPMYNEISGKGYEFGISSFLIDVYGDVVPCNGMSTNMVMENLKEQTWKEIINSEKAKKVCRECKINCWSICNVNSVIRKNIFVLIMWALKEKCNIK